MDGDVGMSFDGVRDLGGEDFTVDSKGVAAGDAGGVGGAHEKRIELAHFLFQKPGRGVGLLAFEGVTADEFAEGVGLVSGAAERGAHFV